MRRLAHASELLDGDLADAATLDGNLRDLRRINRRFGGTDLSIRALRELLLTANGAGPQSAGAPLEVLDVGTGAADIPVSMVGMRGPWGPWHSVRVTATDSRSEVVEAVRRVSPELMVADAIELSIADGRSLPYPDAAFDVAHASLVVHHLEPADAVRFLRELRRVARVGVVINDLARGFLPWIGAWLVLHALTRNSYTLHDGPLSVRRAYTVREARELLIEAGLRPVADVQGFARHRWAIAAAPA